MRLVVARCSVTYAGRLSTRLPEATRLVMLTADGGVSIWADTGSRPLNWMAAPNVLAVDCDEDGCEVWTVTARGETLVITLHDVRSDVDHGPLGVEPGLVKDGVEADLQVALAANPELIEPGLTLVRREHPTALGPVDLLCRDAQGRAVAVEVKRIGGIPGVEQVSRYVACLDRDPLLAPVRGVLAAPDIRPQARVLAEDRGVYCAVVDPHAAGVAAVPREPTLFDADTDG